MLGEPKKSKNVQKEGSFQTDAHRKVKWNKKRDGRIESGDREVFGDLGGNCLTDMVEGKKPGSSGGPRCK